MSGEDWVKQGGKDNQKNNERTRFPADRPHRDILFPPKHRKKNVGWVSGFHSLFCELIRARQRARVEFENVCKRTNKLRT